MWHIICYAAYYMEFYHRAFNSQYTGCPKTDTFWAPENSQNVSVFGESLYMENMQVVYYATEVHT